MQHQPKACASNLNEGQSRYLFGAGSIDGLGMFLGMTTYYDIIKRKCRAKLLMVAKGWSYCTM